MKQRQKKNKAWTDQDCKDILTEKADARMRKLKSLTVHVKAVFKDKIKEPKKREEYCVLKLV